MKFVVWLAVITIAGVPVMVHDVESVSQLILPMGSELRPVDVTVTYIDGEVGAFRVLIPDSVPIDDAQRVARDTLTNCMTTNWAGMVSMVRLDSYPECIVNRYGGCQWEVK